MNATVRIRTLILTCALIAAAAVIADAYYSASAQTADGSIKIDPIPDPADDSSKSIRSRIVMISILKDGSVLKQKEIGISDIPASWRLPVGVYDVRVEGDGVMTVSKSGIHITPKESTDLQVPMRPGQGMCECKYTK